MTGWNEYLAEKEALSKPDPEPPTPTETEHEETT